MTRLDPFLKELDELQRIAKDQRSDPTTRQLTKSSLVLFEQIQKYVNGLDERLKILEKQR